MPSTSLAPFPEVARPDPAGPRPPYRFLTTLGLLGPVLLTAGTVLHPAHADPGSPAAAFAEYAGVSRGLWVAAHLLQLGGITALVLVVVLLAQLVDRTGRSAAARVTTVLGTAGLATAAVLQAVDGVALKAAVDLWSGAEEGRSQLFAAALAVRQVEIGLDALFALLLAASLVTLGTSLSTAPGGSRGLGALALVTAGAAAANGATLALDGFSAATMLATTVSGALALLWLLLVAAWGWRRATTHRP
jgi:hypothetical protein